MADTKITAEQAEKLLEKTRKILRANTYDKTGYPGTGIR